MAGDERNYWVFEVLGDVRRADDDHPLPVVAPLRGMPADFLARLGWEPGYEESERDYMSGPWYRTRATWSWASG